MSDLRFNTGAQSMDAAPDPSKLESRVDLHRTVTQPEKEGLAAGSGTALDVEACVRLLERLADSAAGRAAADVDYAERHERTHPSVATGHYLSAARFAAEATLLRALASALPGMGKDSEQREADYDAHLAAVEALVHARDALYEFGAHAEGCGAARCEDDECSCGLSAAQDEARDATHAGYIGLRAARSAQPEETSDAG